MLLSMTCGRPILFLAVACLTGVAASIAHAGGGSTSSAATRPAATQPSLLLSPQDVVRAQLSAMQHNDAPHPDAGIEVAFEFASPQNRRATGPVGKFAGMVKAGYAPMLNFLSVEYAPPRVQGDAAQQLVRIVDAHGGVIYYVFLLARQADGPQKGCWLTDGVSGLEPPAGPADDAPGDGPIKT